MPGEDETNIGDVIVAVDDEKETLSSDNKAATSSASSTQHSVAEVPRWRFVNTAKKSLGYSSTAAGSHIEGKSAAELAAQYNAPLQVEETNDLRKSKNGDNVGKLRAENGSDVVSEEYEVNVKKIGKVVVPSFMVETSTAESSTQPTKPTETTIEDSTQQQEQQVEYLHELQLETDKMQQEKEHLEHDIDEAKKEKERIQKEKERIEREAELAENKKERMEREAQFIKAEKERLEQERLAGESAELALLENEVAAAQKEDEQLNTQDERRRKYRTYGMYSFICLLLCGIAALLGVLLGGKESQEESNLRGSEAEIENSEPTATTIDEQQEAKCLKFHLAIDTMNMKSNDVSNFEEGINDAIENGLLYSAIMNTYPETNIAGLGHPSSTSSEYAGVGPSSILLDIVGSAIKDFSSFSYLDEVGYQVEFYSAQDIRENTDQNDVMSQLITGFGEISDQVLIEVTNSATNEEANEETRRRGLRISSKLSTLFLGKGHRRLQTLQPVNVTDVREYLLSIHDIRE